VRLGSTLRALEAAVLLAVMRLLLATCAFTRVARMAGTVSDAAAVGDPRQPPATSPVAQGVARALAGAAARLPGESTCLAQALAGGLMLRRRGISSRLVLGVATDQGALRAHAWLVAGDGVVCGGREAAAYTPIAVVGTPAERG
jgi:hypothetical protein